MEWTLPADAMELPADWAQIADEHGWSGENGLSRYSHDKAFDSTKLFLSLHMHLFRASDQKMVKLFRGRGPSRKRSGAPNDADDFGDCLQYNEDVDVFGNAVSVMRFRAELELQHDKEAEAGSRVTGWKLRLSSYIISHEDDGLEVMPELGFQAALATLNWQ